MFSSQNAVLTTRSAGLLPCMNNDYLQERRRALDLWSAKIGALESGEALNVLPFKRVVNI